MNGLFDGFTPSSREEWITLAAKELRGQDPAALDWPQDAAWKMPPIVFPEETPGQLVSGRHDNNWWIGESFSMDKPEDANAAVLQALQNGVQSPAITFQKRPSQKTWKTLLKGIELSYIFPTVHFPEMAAPAWLKSFLDLLPTDASWTGPLYLPSKALTGKNLKDWLALRSEKAPQLRLIQIDVDPDASGPSGVTKALAKSLSEAWQWIQRLEDEGLTDAGVFHFNLSVGNTYLLEIAKVRAWRLLWRNLLQAAGWNAAPAWISARPAGTALTDDSHQNMIRLTAMAMSAVIGGIDRLELPPCDLENELFGRRISRNIQHILQLESHLDWVADPAAGSYYLETLTQKLAQEAWAAAGNSVALSKSKQ